MKIFTYHTTLPGINPHDEARLIGLWAKRWEALGFSPVCLNEHWAALTPDLYKDYLGWIEKVPSINAAGYDRACYLRWLAMANAPVTKPELFLMSDADVIPYERTPFLFYGVRAKKDFKLVCFQMDVPCLVLGTKQLFLEQAMRFSECAARTDWEATQHMSDMYMLERQNKDEPGLIQTTHTVKQYGEDGWEKAAAVHYSHSAMIPANLFPRYKHIPKLRP